MSDLPAGFVLDNQAAPVTIPGLPPGFTLDAPAPVTAEGLAKAGGVGVVKGALGFLGAPADTNEATKTIAAKIGDKLGISPETQARLGQGYDYAAKLGLAGPLASLGTVAPGYQQIKGAVEGVTGPFREAQNVPEHYAETAGEFLPALAGNKGSLIKGLATQVAAPALASETAGQITKGTAAEPYARAAAALVSPLAAEKTASALAPNAARTSVADVRSAATAGYQNPAINAVEFQPGVVDTLANIVTKDLDRSKLNERLAPNTRAIVADLANPINGAAHTMEDLRTTRTLLGDLAGQLENGRPTQEARAATQAKKLIDKYIEAAPQSHIASGDIGAARGILREADANYAAASTADRVSEKLRNADLRAASTYSGGNLNNATRQNLRTLLTSRKGQRGLTPDELQSIEDTVRGSTLGNVTRAAGKLLGGGGGIGSIGTAAAGHMLAGPLGLAAPLLGYGVKKIGDAITRSNSNKIVDQILARSPHGMARAASVAAAQSPDRLLALKRMLLANSATLPLRMPIPQAQ